MGSCKRGDIRGEEPMDEWSSGDENLCIDHEGTLNIEYVYIRRDWK